MIGVLLVFGARGLASVVQRLWWRGRGIVRARQVEVVDVLGATRARLGVDEHEDDSDVALTLFDADERPRVRLGTKEGEGRQLEFFEPQPEDSEPDGGE